MIWVLGVGRRHLTGKDRERVFPAEETEYANGVCFLCGWSRGGESGWEGVRRAGSHRP